MNEDGSPPAPTPEAKRHLWLIWPAAVVLAVVLYFGITYLVGVLTHESTDDAFIAGHIVAIAPRVAGQVAAVQVADNQMVRSNDLLVTLDPTDFAMTLAQKEAAADSQNANYRTMMAAYELVRLKVDTAKAAARKSQADAESAQATARLAQSDFDRAQDLRKQNTLSQQEFDAAQAVHTKAQSALKSALENAATDTAKVAEADQMVVAAREQAAMALAQSQEAQTNVAVAKLNLSYTKLFAPVDGRVTRKGVEPGDYVQTGQQLMSLVPVNVWVLANFKESQLDHMRTNQPVAVEIDALGGKSFRAHVDSVQAGSGAQFSLLPPENASGNFVKVVQRVPVKIIFDEPLPAEHTLGPGLSVVARVRVSTFSLPAAAVAAIAGVLALITAIACRYFLGRSDSAK